MKPQGSKHIRDLIVYEKMRGIPVPNSLESAKAESDDVRPGSLEEVKTLQQWFAADPLGVTAELQKFMDPNLTPSKLQTALEASRTLLEMPDSGMAYLEAEKQHLESAAPTGRFRGSLCESENQDNMIPIRPYERRFEDDSTLGIAGWIIWNGVPALRKFDKFAFRSHGEYTTKFVYELTQGTDTALRVALFADFGTGLSHSSYIAHQFSVENYDAALHLGDVY